MAPRAERRVVSSSMDMVTPDERHAACAEAVQFVSNAKHHQAPLIPARAPRSRTAQSGHSHTLDACSTVRAYGCCTSTPTTVQTPCLKPFRAVCSA